MRDSQRYDAQADAVFRMAARAENPAEKQVYLNIAAGWRKLAAEAARNERRSRPSEQRSFESRNDD
ncbi:MAG TPA: hypothetical protein VHW05_15255 [Phenylobacterium sp.]|jgi:hypothetical protein|nr:hypothetical protein [Phenylobacterium sp.]